MTVVSTKEFNANQEMYFDLAESDPVIIQRGDNLFIVQSFVQNNEPDEIFEPDDDFYNSITMDELRESAHEHIHITVCKAMTVYTIPEVKQHLNDLITILYEKGLFYAVFKKSRLTQCYPHNPKGGV